MQVQFGDIEYREQDGRVWLVFPGKAADDVRATMRSRGFKCSPTSGAWVRQLSEAARYFGRQIAQAVKYVAPWTCWRFWTCSPRNRGRFHLSHRTRAAYRVATMGPLHVRQTPSRASR